jgi:hypothetical protein
VFISPVSNETSKSNSQAKVRTEGDILVIEEALDWITTLTTIRSEEQCNGAKNPPMYEGPTGTPGKEPCFEDPNPKWYKCATIG